MSLKNHDIKPLPFPVYAGAVFFLLLAGFADSIYLSAHHYLVYSGNNRGVKPEHASRLAFYFVIMLSVWYLYFTYGPLRKNLYFF